MRTAFIGLGVMGYPMAGHLARAGHQMTVYNRTRTKVERWVAESGGDLANPPAEAAIPAVTFGVEDTVSTLRKHSIFVDRTTASAVRFAGLIEAPAEGLNFARAGGLDPQAVVDAISNGAAQSWQMDNRPCWPVITSMQLS